MVPQISIVIPLYNESESMPLLVKRLDDLCKSVDLSIEIILVDDGSRDNTAYLMQQVSLTDEKYVSVFLARNYGHQIALSAGLAAVSATEAIMVIDGDLQDPPELLSKFYERFTEGYDVVYAIRKKRKENVAKRFAYHLFYRLLQKISYINIPIDSGDFSLISRRMVDIMNSMPEESRYIRGMRTWIGFKQIGIEYERDKRVAGDSKYSLRMLFNLAYNGIFNFSELPIKFITNLGIASFLIAVAYLSITLVNRFLFDAVPEGFTALLFIIVLFAGVQLMSLGVIGEYVLRIFFQVKGRPLYIVKNKIVRKEIVNG
jgi:polyisoprenyl-phosphate glycosyltransferase